MPGSLQRQMLNGPLAHAPLKESDHFAVRAEAGTAVDPAERRCRGDQRSGDDLESVVLDAALRLAETRGLDADAEETDIRRPRRLLERFARMVQYLHELDATHVRPTLLQHVHIVQIDVRRQMEEIAHVHDVPVEQRLEAERSMESAGSFDIGDMDRNRLDVVGRAVERGKDVLPAARLVHVEQ